MMNAKSARMLVKNSNLNLILKNIKTIATTGGSEMDMVNHFFDQHELKSLKKLGYEVKQLPAEKGSNCFYYNVSW
jgi:hypothetical protein